MKRGVIAIVFFILGILATHFVPVQAEQRSAYSDAFFESVQRVSFDEIKVYNDRVEINQPGIRYAKVTSNSMAPIITDKSVVFEKSPESPKDINIGDVISFYEPSVNGIVLHAVIGIGSIDGQIYYTTKGLANAEPDPWLVPFENVKGVMIGTFK